MVFGGVYAHLLYYYLGQMMMNEARNGTITVGLGCSFDLIAPFPLSGATSRSYIM